jgi:hypothetical protein
MLSLMLFLYLQGYWAEYNRWWRSHLNEVGERPGREAIEAWHATNAARVWPDPVIRPSLQVRACAIVGPCLGYNRICQGGSKLVLL